MTTPTTERDVIAEIDAAIEDARCGQMENDILATLEQARSEIERLRSELSAAREALTKAITNLKHVSIYDDADDDDVEAVEARAAWQRDLDAIRAAIPSGVEAPVVKDSLTPPAVLSPMAEMIEAASRALAKCAWSRANRNDNAFASMAYPGGATCYIDQQWRIYQDDARSALDAALSIYSERASPAVPEGWQLVPKGPTDEMISAAACAIWDAKNNGYVLTGAILALACWRGMLSAAPRAPEGDQP